MMQIQKQSLNAGELSDEMAGRIDLAKVQMGCEVAENVRVLRVGGVTRRAGFEFAALASSDETGSRLQGFRFAGAQGFALEFGENTMRVLQDGQLVLDGLGDPLEYVTPWTAAQVFALQFAQRVNQIVVTHPDVEPYLITRNGDGTWVVEAFPWQERIWEQAVGVDGAPIEGSITLAASALTGTVTITASASLFSEAWEGTRLRLGHTRPQAPIRKQIYDAVGATSAVNLPAGIYGSNIVVWTASPPYNRTLGLYGGLTPVGNRSYFTTIAAYNGGTDYVPGDDDPDEYPLFFMQGAVAVAPQEVRGQWEFETAGTWKGTYLIQRSYDSGATWQAIRVLTSSNDKNYLVQDLESMSGGVVPLIRVLILDFDAGSDAIRFSFTGDSSLVQGVAIIGEYLTATTVTAVVERPFESTAVTGDWQEDAFSPKNGYAKSCTYHQKRLMFGGSMLRPQSIWGSKIRQPFNFLTGSLAEDGLSFETEATEYESVLWLASHLALVVGTTSGIWAISAPNGLSITPEDNAITRQVRLGVYEGIPAVLLQNNVLYLQTKGRKIHELTGGSVEYGGYTDVDLTQLASHITRGGVVQITSGEVPDSTLYVVTGGQLAILTYERAQNVVGWARWVTDGTIESVAVCPGADEDDDVYVVVSRTNGRFIERLAPDMLRREEDGDVENFVFLDSSVTKVAVDPETPLTEIDGLEHLDGRIVEVFADGESVGMITVTGGAATLPNEALRATAGLPYESLVRTMPLDQGAIGDKAGISDVVVRVRNTLGAECSQDGTIWSPLIAITPPTTGSGPLPMFTGDTQATVQSSWRRKPTFSIRQTSPLPMTILAIRMSGKTSR